jgi:hypothetical protein
VKNKNVWCPKLINNPKFPCFKIQEGEKTIVLQENDLWRMFSGKMSG